MDAELDASLDYVIGGKVFLFHDNVLYMVSDESHTALLEKLAEVKEEPGAVLQNDSSLAEKGFLWSHSLMKTIRFFKCKLKKCRRYYIIQVILVWQKVGITVAGSRNVDEE